MGQGAKIKVGLVQISNSFSNQNYFPYSIGIIQAYAQKYLNDPEKFEFLLPIYKRIPVQEAVEKLLDADIIFFSLYVWNLRISLKIAEEIKNVKPETVIVFGGPQVPEREAEKFLRQNVSVDFACHGEGEKPCLAILENFSTGKWEDVPSISYINDMGELIQNPKCERITDLNTIPSPYLAGVFDQLIKANPEEEWLVLWETNRGCPFSCIFCDWGSANHGRVYYYDISRLFEEVDWFSQHKIEFVYCCDANYGIHKRDLDIANYVAKNKERYGYPMAFSVQNTKNSTEQSYKIQKALSDAGLNKGVTLSVQSMNQDVLKAVNRKNISIDVFQKLQEKFSTAGITTYTDLILGLPNETYNTFKDGVSELIEKGQHNRIQFNNLSILTNSEINVPKYREMYGLITRETKIVNIHGDLSSTDEIFETQELVVETNTMPEEEWVKARAFGWMVALLHFDKCLQIPLIILNKICKINYRELIELFTEGNVDLPIISEIHSFFISKAEDIQNGGVEYCQSPEWLNIWWPADEYILIKLCTENKLGAFYEEVLQVITDFLRRKEIDVPKALLEESIYLNYVLMKLPFQQNNKSVKLSYNIYEVYVAALTGSDVSLKEGEFNYEIDRESKSWTSWDEWFKEVIWYENKKGAYIYNCTLINKD